MHYSILTMKQTSKQVTPTRAIVHLLSALPVVIILTIVFILSGLSDLKAQNYSRRLPIGYIFHSYKPEAVQRQGQNTDYRGIINGGVNLGGVGVNGFNNGNTYTYNRQETVYVNVAYFWFNDGRSCNYGLTPSYLIPRGAGVYDQNGLPWTYKLFIFN